MKFNLKPCPYCGSAPRVLVSANDNIFVPINERIALNYYSVRCRSCGRGTARYIDIDRAIEAWNKEECINETD